MVFNSDVFLFAFLPVVFTAFWLLRSKASRYVLLTVSGYVFYGYWDWRFCFLLLLSSLVSFTAGLLIERASTRAEARRWLVASVGFDLSMLGFFKYYNFFAGNLHALAPSIAPPLLQIVLPIGISFYTFHTISYIVDVADGTIEPTHDLFEYLAYVSLFSQLVAGPIVRFRQIEDDLDHVDRPPRDAMFARGVGMFVIGLVKKVVVADRIGALVDPLLSHPASMSAAAAWAAALGYTFQLYFDFSGYSDMALGLGSLFGLRIPENFNAPYTAAGIRDFWRRWHISLSTWLRDYLYIRLGGSRGSAARTRLNLIATMALGGLWHGASWTFVVWGLYHGLLLAAERGAQTWIDRLPPAAVRAATFLLVVVGWVIFRAPTLQAAGVWLQGMAGLGAGMEGPPARLIVWIALCLVAVNAIREPWQLRLGATRAWALAYAVAFFVAYLAINGRNTVFLYYQF